MLIVLYYYHLMFAPLGYVHHVKNSESFLNRLVSLKGDRLNLSVLPLGAS
jgi:hypothetical protein